MGVVTLIMMCCRTTEEAVIDAKTELEHQQDQSFMILGFMMCCTILAAVLANLT